MHSGTASPSPQDAKVRPATVGKSPVPYALASEAKGWRFESSRGGFPRPGGFPAFCMGAIPQLKCPLARPCKSIIVRPVILAPRRPDGLVKLAATGRNAGFSPAFDSEVSVLKCFSYRNLCHFQTLRSHRKAFSGTRFACTGEAKGDWPIGTFAAGDRGRDLIPTQRPAERQRIVRKENQELWQ